MLIFSYVDNILYPLQMQSQPENIPLLFFTYKPLQRLNMIYL